MEKLGMHFFVSGKVQGVFFRAFTQGHAQQLKLSGWAKNLSDGRVEVVAFGEKDQLQQLLKWLQKGSDLATVTNVDYEEIPWQQQQGFQVE